MSRREQKAPAREQPTTGEDTPSSPSGAGEGLGESPPPSGAGEDEGESQGREEVPRVAAVVVTAMLTGGVGTSVAAPTP